MAHQPYIDNALIPDEWEGDSPKYVMMIVQISTHRKLTTLVSLDNDNILIEATDFVLYEAYQDDNLIPCPERKMMCLPFNEFKEYVKNSPKLEDGQPQGVEEEMQDIRERLLERRDTMGGNPQTN